MSSKHDVFISYCREDSAIMASISNCLLNNSLKVWVDTKDIELGSASWQNDVAIAIKEAKCLVVILSPSVPESRWVREELAFAEIHNKSIYPVLALGNPETSVPFGYVTSNWIDIRGQTVCGENLNRLGKTIQKKFNLVPHAKEYFQSIVKITGQWTLEHSAGRLKGHGTYDFDEAGKFRAKVFNPLLNEYEEQIGTWVIENNETIIQGISSMRGQSMSFRAVVDVVSVDIDRGVIEANVTSNGFKIFGRLKRRNSLL